MIVTAIAGAVLGAALGALGGYTARRWLDSWRRQCELNERTEETDDENES